MKQACRLPILLYKPDLLKMKGKVFLNAPKVKIGMIQLGMRNVSIFPNTGIMWENKGGTVVFNGRCIIGNNSFISIGENGHLIINDDFISSSTLRLVSYRKIEFGVKTRVGWNGIFMDTNFHQIVDMKSGKSNEVRGNILIGNYNWLGTGCSIMHSVDTPERCIFGMGSILTRGSKYESYCLHGGNPLQILKRDVMRDYGSEG